MTDTAATERASLADATADRVLITEDKPPDKMPAPQAARLTGAAGITFAVLFLVGFSLLTWIWEDGEELKWYADSSNRVKQVVGAFIVAFAGLALMIFITGLRTRLEARGDRQLSMIMATAGGVFIAALYVGATVIAAVSGGIELGNDPLPTDVGLVRTVQSVGFGAILLFGGMAASLCVFSAALAGRHSGLFPRWLVVVGFVAAVALLFSFIYLPLVALVIWVLIAGIWSMATASTA